MARSLGELIKEYPELGEAFAEFENRISFLEASQTTRETQDTIPVYQDNQWTNRQWDAVNQLRAQVLHMQNKLNEHVDKSKKKERGQY